MTSTTASTTTASTATVSTATDTTANSTASTTATSTELARISPAGRQSAGFARAALAGIAAVVAAVLGIALASPAQAFTYSGRSNVPVLPTVYQVLGSHYNVGSAVTGPMYKPWVYQSGPVAQRVSTSGAQTVKVVYTVYRYNGSTWVKNYTASGSSTIGASAVSAKLPNLSYLPNAGAGYYSVTTALTWTSPIGSVLGSVSISMSETRDYACSTTRTCSVGNGFVYIGS